MTRSPFALRSDKVLLLSIEEIPDIDLTDRVLWTGIELTPEEMELVHGRAVNAEHEAASIVIFRLVTSKKPVED